MIFGQLHFFLLYSYKLVYYICYVTSYIIFVFKINNYYRVYPCTHAIGLTEHCGIFKRTQQKPFVIGLPISI